MAKELPFLDPFIMTSQQNEEINSLMTPSAQALSLSPPRAPPHDSAHRTLLVGGNPSNSPLATHHTDCKHHDTIRHRIQHLLHQSHLHMPSRIPHPHLPSSLEWTDKMTRCLGVTLPIPWQNKCRDSGGFRWIADTLVTISAPAMAILQPSIARNYIQLTTKCQNHRYGSHPMQVIHMLFPSQQDYKQLSIDKPRGLLVFVHGGAWGSGLPWMYRLVALPFLKLGMAVAIVGYRVYPDACVDQQVADIEQAITYIATEFPDLCQRLPRKDNPNHLGTCLMGHSSGAHIALLMLVDRARRRAIHPNATPTSLEFDSFIALSGPFDISHHFDYEAARGVEELSPMKPANGYSRQAFRKNSPALRWKSQLAEISESNTNIRELFPQMLLVHGIEDTTVPFTATAEAARILRSCGIVDCEEAYVAKIGHQDTVVECMVGGKTRDVVVDWLKKANPDESRSDCKCSTTMAVNSKL